MDKIFYNIYVSITNYLNFTDTNNLAKCCQRLWRFYSKSPYHKYCGKLYGIIIHNKLEAFKQLYHFSVENVKLICHYNRLEMMKIIIDNGNKKNIIKHIFKSGNVEMAHYFLQKNKIKLEKLMLGIIKMRVINDRASELLRYVKGRTTSCNLLKYYDSQKICDEKILKMIEYLYYEGSELDDSSDQLLKEIVKSNNVQLFETFLHHADHKTLETAIKHNKIEMVKKMLHLVTNKTMEYAIRPQHYENMEIIKILEPMSTNYNRYMTRAFAVNNKRAINDYMFKCKWSRDFIQVLKRIAQFYGNRDLLEMF